MRPKFLFIPLLAVLFFIFSLTGNALITDTVYSSIAEADDKKADGKIKLKKKRDRDKDNDDNGIPGKIRLLQEQINALQTELDNIQLTPGPQGDPGPAGPQGPAGANGADGADGAVGATGPAGADGVAGAEGPQGPKGDTGAQGPEGPQGPQGPVGFQGPQGDLGPEGPPGSGGARLTYVSRKPDSLFIPPANTGVFADVPQRAVDFIKHSGTSILRVTYHDFFYLQGFQSTTTLNLQFILKELTGGTEIVLPVEPTFIRRMVQHLSGSSFSTADGGPKTFHFILDPQLLGANASFLVAGNYSLRVQSHEDNFNGNFQSTVIGNYKMPFQIQVEEIEP